MIAATGVIGIVTMVIPEQLLEQVHRGSTGQAGRLEQTGQARPRGTWGLSLTRGYMDPQKVIQRGWGTHLDSRFRMITWALEGKDELINRTDITGSP